VIFTNTKWLVLIRPPLAGFEVPGDTRMRLTPPPNRRTLAPIRAGLSAAIAKTSVAGRTEWHEGMPGAVKSVGQNKMVAQASRLCISQKDRRDACPTDIAQRFELHPACADRSQMGEFYHTVATT
jgi:hypothetical protein